MPRYRPLAASAASGGGLNWKHLHLSSHAGSIDVCSPPAAVRGTVPGGSSRRAAVTVREPVDLPGGAAAAAVVGVVVVAGSPPRTVGRSEGGGVAAADAAGEYWGWSFVTQWPSRCAWRAIPVFLCRSCLREESAHGWGWGRWGVRCHRGNGGSGAAEAGRVEAGRGRAGRGEAGRDEAATAGRGEAALTNEQGGVPFLRHRRRAKGATRRRW